MKSLKFLIVVIFLIFIFLYTHQNLKICTLTKHFIYFFSYTLHKYNIFVTKKHSNIYTKYIYTFKNYFFFANRLINRKMEIVLTQKSKQLLMDDQNQVFNVLYECQ